MLGQEDAQPRADPARHQEDRQAQQRGEHQQRRRDVAPLAAEPAQPVAAGGDQDQVAAGDRQRGRVEDRLARHADVELPLRIAGGGDGQQRHQQHVGVAAGHPPGAVDAAEQQGLAVHQQVEGEQREQREAQELDRPAPAGRGVAVDLLEADQAEDRGQRARGEQGAGVAADQFGAGRGAGQHQGHHHGAPPGAVDLLGLLRADGRRRAGIGAQADQEQDPEEIAQRLGDGRERRRDGAAGEQAGHGRAPGHLAQHRDQQQAADRVAAPANRQQHGQRQEGERCRGVTDEAEQRGVHQRLSERPCRGGPPAPCRPGSAGRGTGSGSSRSTGRTAACPARLPPRRRRDSAPATSR